MMNYGKMVIVGNSIAELEQDLEMLKITLKSGKMCAVGGSSVAEVENGLAMMKQMMGTTPSPCNCSCGCGCCSEEEEELEIEDEEEEYLEDEDEDPEYIAPDEVLERIREILAEADLI